MSWDISPRMWVGIDEPWVASLAERWIREGAVVYDIGAHIGYTALLFARRVGQSGAVHAFELLPSVAEKYLRTSVTANHLSQVRIHVTGVSDAPATLDLPVGDTLMSSLDPSRAQGGRLERCNVTTLDAWRRDHGLPLPSFIKMDIEGAEVAALRGAVETLASSRPILVVEFHSLELLKQGLELLTPLGYTFSTQHGPLKRDDLFKMTFFHESVLCQPN